MQTLKSFSIDDQSLRHLLPDFDKVMDDIDKPVARSRSTKKELSTFRVFQRLANRRVSSSINLGSRFEGDFGVKNLEFDYFAGVFSNDIKAIPGTNVYKRMGIGLRIRLKASDIKASMNLGFAAFAASAELKLASVEYKIETFGISDAEILGNFPRAGDFNYAKYQKILEFSRKTKKYLSKNIDKLALFPIEIIAADSFPDNDFSKSHSFFFGAKYLAAGKSLRETIDMARKKTQTFDEDAIQYIYSYFEVMDAYSAPPGSSQAKARKWLRGEIL